MELENAAPEIKQIVVERQESDGEMDDEVRRRRRKKKGEICSTLFTLTHMRKLLIYL